MQVMLMRLMSKGEYLIVPKGTKFTGSGKLGLTTKSQRLVNRGAVRIILKVLSLKGCLSAFRLHMSIVIFYHLFFFHSHKQEKKNLSDRPQFLTWRFLFGAKITGYSICNPYNPCERFGICLSLEEYEFK